jgi:hypothetical protein
MTDDHLIAEDDPDLYEDEPAREGLLDEPGVREKIEAALAAVREGRVRRGKTAEELRQLAREQRALGPRPRH